MSELPRGTVTFAFTDIEGSTELLKELGEAYANLLSEHRRIVRESFAAADGIEMDTQGDAFFFVFPRARDAVAASVEVQRAHAAATWPGGAVVRVRIGLHTGEPALHDEGYVGLDVVRAARICTVGQGGQILLSESTRALLGSGLPDGVSVFPLGQRHLRGIDEPERVYEVAIEGLEEVERAPEKPAEAPARAVGPELESDVERRFEGLSERLSADIQERVLRRLERTLGRVVPGDETAGEPESDVDEIAARMESLGDEIEARIRAQLARKGIAPDDD